LNSSSLSSCARWSPEPACHGVLAQPQRGVFSFFLVLNFGTVAVFICSQRAFIAMAQVTVYAGAIMVLFRS
jgi:hypothetical protein